jgi:hypothetical protein
MSRRALPPEPAPVAPPVPTTATDATNAADSSTLRQIDRRCAEGGRRALGSPQPHRPCRECASPFPAEGGKDREYRGRPRGEGCRASGETGIRRAVFPNSPVEFPRDPFLGWRSGAPRCAGVHPQLGPDDRTPSSRNMKRWGALNVKPGLSSPNPFRRESSDAPLKEVRGPQPGDFLVLQFEPRPGGRPSGSSAWLTAKTPRESDRRGLGANQPPPVCSISSRGIRRRSRVGTLRADLVGGLRSRPNGRGRAGSEPSDQRPEACDQDGRSDG